MIERRWQTATLRSYNTLRTAVIRFFVHSIHSDSVHRSQYLQKSFSALRHRVGTYLWSTERAKDESDNVNRYRRVSRAQFVQRTYARVRPQDGFCEWEEETVRNAFTGPEGRPRSVRVLYVLRGKRPIGDAPKFSHYYKRIVRISSVSGGGRNACIHIVVPNNIHRYILYLFMRIRLFIFSTGSRALRNLSARNPPATAAQPRETR